MTGCLWVVFRLFRDLAKIECFSAFFFFLFATLDREAWVHRPLHVCMAVGRSHPPHACACSVANHRVHIAVSLSPWMVCALCVRALFFTLDRAWLGGELPRVRASS